MKLLSRGDTLPLSLVVLAISITAVFGQGFGVTVVQEGNGLALQYEASTDSYYRVHAANSLTGGWTVLDLQLGTQSVQTWVHSGVIESNEFSFYRVGRVPRTNSLDFDGDRLGDAYELEHELDFRDPDMDSDLVADGDEVYAFQSSPISPFSGPTVYYGFSTDLQDWGVETGAYGTATVTWTNTGYPVGGSLAVAPGAGVGYGDYYIRDRYVFDNCNVVPRPIYGLWIYVPADAPVNAVQLQLWVKSTSDDWTAHYGGFHTPLAGQWNAVSWDMSVLSTEVLADIDEWAVKLVWNDRSAWSGSVLLDTLHVMPFLPETNLPPIITAVTAESGTAGKYQKFEVTIGLTNVARLNPYDPDDVNLEVVFTSPSEVDWNICGFYMEEDGDAYGEGGWKVRFAANETGVWDYKVRVSNRYGTNESSGHSFTCIASDDPGWIKVSDDDSHYLEHADDSAFYGIGYCRPYDANQEGLFAEAAEHGINMLHWWMAPWDTMLTVQGTGDGREDSTFYSYEQGRAAEIDEVVGYAEQYNIKLIFTIWTHDALRDFNHHTWRKNGSWARAFDNDKVDEPEFYINAFSSLDDPPMNQKFFSDEKYKEYQDKLYRYIIARWGYSTSVGMWQLASELYGTYANSLKCIRWQDPEFVTNKNALIGRNPYDYMDTNQVDGADHTIPWITYIHNYFKTNDPYGHPTTACNETDQYWDEGFGIVDIPQVHSYAESYSWVTPPITLAKYHKHMRAFDKPVFIGETGTWKWRTFQPDFLRASMWPGLCSGGAITPMMWTVPAFGLFCDPVMGPWLDAMADEAKLFSDFIQGIEFHKLGLTPAQVSATEPRETAETLIESFESGIGDWSMFGSGIVAVAISTNFATDGSHSLRLDIDMGTWDEMPDPGSGIVDDTLNADWEAYWPDGTLRMDLYIPEMYHATTNPDGFLKGINRDPRSIIEVAAEPGGGWNWYSTRNEYGAEHGGWKKLTVGMLWNLEFRLDEIASSTEARAIRAIKFWMGDAGILKGPVYVDNIRVGLYPFNTWGMVSSNGEFAMAWVQDRQWTNTTSKNVSFQISGLQPDSTYNLVWWNSKRDGAINSFNANAPTGTLSVTVPSFRRDTAVQIHRVGPIGGTVHDVSVMTIEDFDWLVRGPSRDVDVRVVNQGTERETFKVVLTDVTDGQVIGTNTINSLRDGDDARTTFTWNCATASVGTHTLLAVAEVLSGETDTNDNSRTGKVKLLAETPPWDPCDRLGRWAPKLDDSDGRVLEVSTNRFTEGGESFYFWYRDPTNNQAVLGFDNVFEDWSTKQSIALDIYREGGADSFQFQMRSGSNWVWHFSTWTNLVSGWNTNILFDFTANNWARLEGTNYTDNVVPSGLNEMQRIYLKFTGHTNEGAAYIDNIRLAE